MAPLGAKAESLRGQRVRIQFKESRNGNYTNRYLTSIEPATASQGASNPTRTQSANTAVGRIMGRNAIAKAAVPTLLGKSDGTPEAILKILNDLAHWSETGEDVAFWSAPGTEGDEDDLHYEPFYD